jgi:glutamyl-tRNA synthetase
VPRVAAGRDRSARGCGQPRAIRFLVPDGRTPFHDLVHGRSTSTTPTIEDFVVLAIRRLSDLPPLRRRRRRDDAGDAVVRGDDHISNTPKQVLLYQAMDAPVPAFAHVPLILGPTRSG